MEIRQAASGSGAPGLMPLSRPGVLAVVVGTGRTYFPVGVTIDGVTIGVGTAPTGASLIVDVNKNGTTVFTTQANRPTITAAAFASAEKVPDVTAIAAGDYVSIDVDQVGSTVAGADLTAVIRYH